MRLLHDDRATVAHLSGGRENRGMALLVVLTSLAVLTAIAVDLSYNVRVDASLAGHARDELRAYYLARSATALGRLVVHFQFQLDTQAGQLQKAVGAAAGGGGNAGALASLAGGGGMGGALSALSSVRLWDLLPVESSAVTAFVGMAAGAPSGEPPPPPAELPMGEAVPMAGLQSFGTFDGGFHAEIQDEEAKRNVNKLNNPGTRGTIAAAQLLLLMKDERWDFLFEEDTLHHERYTREELLVFFRDYLDEDETETQLNLAAADAFVAGFADEKGPYVRFEPRYDPKNALFDTVDELQLVPGISDRWMAAFRDRLTVYPDINSRLNVNTNDPVQQFANILAAAQDPNHQLLRDPTTIQGIFEELAALKMFGPFIGITVQQFVQIIESAGIPVQAALKHNAAQNDLLGDKSQTFTIKAVGTVGEVQKTITTVVRYDEGLGKLLYFRED